MSGWRTDSGAASSHALTYNKVRASRLIWRAHFTGTHTVFLNKIYNTIGHKTFETSLTTI